MRRGAPPQGIVHPFEVRSLGQQLMLQQRNGLLGVQCTQILIVGLVLRWLARKGNVESAIAGHVGLNLAVGIAALGCS